MSAHKNIVEFYDIYQYKRCLFMVQELMEFNLSSILSSSLKFPNKVLNYIIKEILEALSYMHSKSRVHRDIKSDNVLLNANGKVKLADMGFAVQLTEEVDTRRTLAGTPCWISPEVIEKSNYNEKTDIWSLGVVIIELIEGQPPNLGQRNGDIMHAILREGVFFSNPQNVPSEYIEFTKFCLKKNPAERKSAYELLQSNIFQNISTEQEAGDHFLERKKAIEERSVLDS